MAGYSAWHPSGEFVVYSANDIFQFFHAVGEVRDVFDRESDLALYHVDSNRVSTSPENFAVGPAGDVSDLVARRAFSVFLRGRSFAPGTIQAGAL